MRFKLSDTRKQISDNDLINDLRSVANNLGKHSLKLRDYCEKNGAKYSYQTAKKRFGSWEKVLEKAGLETEKSVLGVEYNETQIKTSLLVEDIKKVAKKLGNSNITMAEYDKHGNYGSSTLVKRFNGWNNAKRKAGLLVPRNYRATVDEYMKNIYDLWVYFGRQPKYSEVVKPLSKFSISAYENKFGTWTKALEEFVNYVENDGAEKVDENQRDDDIVELKQPVSVEPKQKRKAVTKRTPRKINLSLRWKVLKRDRYRCVCCGASPAEDPNVKLHVDHIVPWSEGGETTIDNLQTLCQKCNLGKSNLI